jgi:hypothetical protein
METFRNSTTSFEFETEVSHNHLVIDPGKTDIVDALNSDESGNPFVGDYTPGPHYENLDEEYLSVLIIIDDKTPNARYFRGYVVKGKVYLEWEMEFAEDGETLVDKDFHWDGLPDDFEEGEHDIRVIITYHDPDDENNFFAIADDDRKIDIFNNDGDNPETAQLLITDITVYKNPADDNNDWISITVKGCVNYTREYALFGCNTEISKTVTSTGATKELDAHPLGKTVANPDGMKGYARWPKSSRAVYLARGVDRDAATFTFRKPESDRFFFHARMIKEYP